jgi:G:T/U-mismatch repair DNA glycosylase
LLYDLKLDNKVDKQKLLTELKIAITDIISACERKDDKNSDNNLINKSYNKRITEILKDKPIRKILFTSKNVHSEFLEHFDNPKNADLIILPSPSPIYRRLSLLDKVIEYKKYFPNL